MSTKLFTELGLSAEVLKAIEKMGFEKASPIQAQAIPVIMEGLDVVGQSQTGSGKTAAFGVPAVEKVDPQERKVQVLILCPTRELAVQVSEEIHKLAHFKKGIHALPIYGGQSYERQFLGLRQGAQIVIGTPGRVMDHMRRGTLRLDAVKMVVLDEADVMLDMGFREDIEFILKAVPATRQTVFFSATMPRAIQELIRKHARDPRNIQMEETARTVPTVEQVYYEVDRRFKIELLTRLIDIHDLKLGIIFCNTKAMVDDLVDQLNAQGYSADRLHGDMTQNMRDRVMNKFRKSGLEFLVATDVAARGIDVDDVQVVFNYDLPYDPEDYLHRIGRTGRAGRSGRAISFVAGRELFQVGHIERFTKTRIQRAKIPTEGEVEEARASATLERLRATLQSGEFQRQDHLVERLLEEGFASTDIASALLHLWQAAEGVPSRRGMEQEENSRPERRQPREGFTERTAGRNQPARGRGPERERSPSRSRETSMRVREPRPNPVTPPVEATVPKKQPASEAAAIVQETKPVVPSSEEHKKPAAPERTAPRGELPSEAPAPKQSRRTPGGQTRLFMNVGSASGIKAEDVVSTILGETGLPAKTLGAVDIRERHLFVDVEAEHAKGIV
ncbi:MAG TPA: DEAD/DEAH box helicase, partial [Verrucomicrobiae bacterium]